MAQTRKQPILNRKWLDICDENVRAMNTTFEEKRTLLYLIWKERAGNCDCDEVHKRGRYCDNCGKKIRHYQHRNAQDIVTGQIAENKEKTEK